MKKDMKKLNIVKLLVASAFVTILAPSCLEDFLEKPAGGSVTSDTIFHTQNQAQYAVAKMYDDCIENFYAYCGTQGYSNSSSRPDVISDQVYLTSNVNWVAANFSLSAFYSGTMTSAATPDPSYGGHFLGIRRANLVLKYIDNVVDAESGWIDDVKGQAYFCLAMQHYELFRYYGGIPLIREVLGEGEVKIPRSSVESTVNQIVEWCDQAASLLPETRSAADFGRVTKLAALALKSRVLLYAASPMYNTPSEYEGRLPRFGDERDSVLCYPSYDKNRWQLAADAAKAVLDNASAAGVSLYNTGKPETTGDTYATIGDYESVWNVYANQEIILANTKRGDNSWSTGLIWIHYTQSRAGAWASQGGVWGVMNNVPIEFAQLYEKRDGSTWTAQESGDDLSAYLQGLNLDPRFYQSICYGGMQYNSSKGELQYYKQGEASSDGKLGGNDQDPYGFAMETFKIAPRIENASYDHLFWPVFRLAEFYLSYAEALNELNGPTAEAYNAMNLVRSRAGMPDKSGLDQASFRTAIHNERSIELAFENHRYNDLLRWVEADVALNKAFNGFKTSGKLRADGSIAHAWTISLFENRIFPKKYYYVPYPIGEISKNYLGGGEGWDGQNPGW